MKFFVYVNSSAAIKAGNNQCGWQIVDGEAVLPSLSPEDRAFLAEITSTTYEVKESIPKGSIVPGMAGNGSLLVGYPMLASTEGAIQSIIDNVRQSREEKIEKERREVLAATAKMRALADRLISTGAQVLVENDLNLGRAARHLSTEGMGDLDMEILKEMPEIRALQAEATEIVNRTKKAQTEALIQKWISHPIRELRKDFFSYGNSGYYLPGEDPRVQALQAALTEDCKAREVEEAEKERRKVEALDHFVENHGSATQIAHLRAGYMAEEDKLHLVRDSVFGGLSSFPRYAKLRPEDVDHEYGCEEVVCFKVIPVPVLTGPQFEEFRQLQAAAPKGALLEPRLHTAVCQSDSCPGEASRYSIRITVEWNDRKLSREFSLCDA